MTIHTLMNTPLVTGQEEPGGIPIPGVQEREDDDEVCSFPAVFSLRSPVLSSLIREERSSSPELPRGHDSLSERSISTRRVI